MVSHQYGENGFVPTVTSIEEPQDGAIIMETLDPRPETDLIGQPGEPLKRRGDLVSDEQKEQLALYERN